MQLEPPFPEPPPPHPGIVTWVNEDDGTRKEEPASEVPNEIKYALADGQYVPVTELRMHSGGDDTLTIHSFGADGALLGWTVMIRSPERGDDGESLDF